MGTLRTSLILELVDKVTGPARKIQTSMQSMTAGIKSRLGATAAAVKNVGSDIGNVTKEARGLSAKLALIGGGAGWLIKTQLVDTASKFERFRTILETVEGTSQKASKSMDWVSDFAAKTPYELDQVMDSFVKLRAYGMDPTNGLMRTLGDTAAAMGKPLNMAVEAIADAVTGENERLKEFGIKAQTKGGRIRYEYSDRDGKTRFKTVLSNNREQIRSTLEAIWNERYAGAMEKMSKTYVGMMSNLKDQWTRFKMMVMQYGAFDFLKGKLEGLLKKVDEMAANGKLKELAALWGKNIAEGFKAAYGAATALIQIMQGLGRVVSWLAGILGGYKNLGIILATLMAGKFLFSVAALTWSFIKLGREIKKVIAELLILKRVQGVVNMTPPGVPPGTGGQKGLPKVIPPILTPLIPVAVAAILAFLSRKGGEHLSRFEAQTASSKQLIDWRSKHMVMGGGPNSFQVRTIDEELARRRGYGGSLFKEPNNIGGTIKLEIDSATPVKVKEMRPANPWTNLSVDTGLATVGR